MNSIVFYFSGTGNTFFLAKRTGSLISADIRSIADYKNSGKIRIDENVLCIFSPIYYGDLPNIVKEFLGKIEGLENKYIALGVNYGGAAGLAIQTAKKAVKSKNGKISLCLSVHMPQNAFFKKSENYGKIYREADKLCGKAAEKIKQGKKGTVSSNILADKIFEPIFRLLKPQYKNHLLKITGLGKEQTIEQAIYRMDGTFTVNSAYCNGCKLCEKICPVDNIDFINNIPHWNHQCENCLACYNFCPNNAISGQMCEKNYFYKHPQYKLSEALREKRT